MKCYKHKTPFTSRQQASILRLYVEQQLTVLVTAKRLRLSAGRVFRFLHERGVTRPRGSGRRKLDPAKRKRLESELLATPDAVLARRYGLTRERIRQIRQALGYPSSRIVRQEWVSRARAERQQREKQERQRAKELRQQQYRVDRLPAIDRLSDRWKSGAPIRELAKEYGVSRHCLAARIQCWRKLYPEKFPYRFARMTPAWCQGVEGLWRRFWQGRLPAINQLSKRWKSGAPVRQLAREHGISRDMMQNRIRRLRKHFPAKFPYRFPPQSPRVPGAVVIQRS